MTLLIKLRLDEIIGQEQLSYDILDSQGNIIYAAGESIQSRRLKQISGKGLFRSQAKLPLEWIIQDELPNITDKAKLTEIINSPEPPAEIPPNFKLPYLINRQEAIPYISSMFGFWQKLESGEKLDMALLEVVQHSLIASIINKMDQLHFITQLNIRDGVTHSHTLDVTAVSIALGAKLGLSQGDLELLALGALLHDIGKLKIPKQIMFKPTRLTDQEFEVMQLHPEIGYRIIREDLKLPEEVARPALEHQELYAGGGYPQNLYKDEIHFFSQIVKIADVYDALTSKRPYKEAICSDKAIKIMLLEGPKSFNPAIMKEFLELANYPESV